MSHLQLNTTQTSQHFQIAPPFSGMHGMYATIYISDLEKNCEVVVKSELLSSKIKYLITSQLTSQPHNFRKLKSNTLHPNSAWFNSIPFATWFTWQNHYTTGLLPNPIGSI